MLPDYAWWVAGISDIYGDDGKLNSTMITRVSPDGSIGVPGWYTTPWDGGFFNIKPFGDSYPTLIGSDSYFYWVVHSVQGRDVRILVQKVPLLVVPGVLRSETVLDRVVTAPDSEGYSENNLVWYVSMYWDAGLVVRATCTKQTSIPQYGWVRSVQTNTIRGSGDSYAYLLRDTRWEGVYDSPTYAEEGVMVRFEDGAVAFVDTSVYIPI